MAKLTNTPSETTVLELEARKSFAFHVEIVNEHGVPLDLSGSVLIFTLGLPGRPGQGPEVLLVSHATEGVFRLQAAELDLDPGTYHFAITWRANGYSLVITKGEVKVRPNVDTSAVEHIYADGSPSTGLSVQLQNRNVIRVVASGGVTAPGDGLTALGVPSGHVPTALGDNTWEWREASKDLEFTDTESIVFTVDGDKESGFTVSADTTDLIATTQYVDDAVVQGSGTIIGATIGTIQIWPGEEQDVPEGWLICDGREVSRADYSSLFAVIGTMFGAGDGSTTFNLPKLSGRVPVGLSGSDDFAYLGQQGGAKTHQLTVDELPAHTHSASTGAAGDHNHGGSTGSSTVGLGGGHNMSTVDGTSTNRVRTGSSTTGGQDAAYPTSAHTHSISSSGNHTHSVTVESTGGGAAHNNLQPYLVVLYIIKARMLASEVSGLDTTTRTLTVTGPVADPQHAATKEYVDEEVKHADRVTEGEFDLDRIPRLTNDKLPALVELGTEHLDTVVDLGWYVQASSARAAFDLGYPAERAGWLEVLPRGTSGMRMQRYTTQHTGQQFIRVYTMTWLPWREVLSDDTGITKATTQDRIRYRNSFGQTIPHGAATNVTGWDGYWTSPKVSYNSPGGKARWTVHESGLWTIDCSIGLTFGSGVQGYTHLTLVLNDPDLSGPSNNRIISAYAEKTGSVSKIVFTNASATLYLSEGDTVSAFLYQLSGTDLTVHTGISGNHNRLAMSLVRPA